MTIKFLTLFIIVPIILFAHKVYNKDMETIIAESDLVMTAKIQQIKTTRETCETSYEYELIPQKILTGAFTADKIYFCYSIHFWKEDRGCPSVHYILPPTPREVTKDQIIIAVFKNSAAVQGGFRGTGIFEITDKDAIQKLIDKHRKPVGKPGR